MTKYFPNLGEGLDNKCNFLNFFYFLIFKKIDFLSNMTNIFNKIKIFFRNYKIIKKILMLVFFTKVEEN